MAATPWVMIANLASLSTLLTNTKNGGEDLEESIEKETEEEDDSGDQADEKLRLSKRQNNYMDDDESMPPLHS